MLNFSVDVERWMDVACAHHQAGRLGEAEALYRQVLGQQPQHADALHLLGVIAYQVKRYDVAVELIRRAIAIVPTNAGYYSNLGNALKDWGRLEEAIASFREAVRVDPKLAEAQSNLGNALWGAGRFEEALAACERAAMLKPSAAGVQTNLGNVLKEMGRLEEAMVCYEKSMALEPNQPDVLSNMGATFKMQGRFDEAIASYEKALLLRPEFAEVWSDLGNALWDVGRPEEAVASCERALALLPDLVAAHGNLVFTLLFHPGYDAGRIARANEEWNTRHAEPLKGKMFQHERGMGRDAAEKRLRIGYVSSDFRDHVVARNLLPLFRERDREKFEVFCYYNGTWQDGTTREFQKLSEGWRDIAKWEDQRVAEQVKGDGIDILVDLSLHTSGNRLLVFARKPAPVQATFAGYPGSTGLRAIDYRLTDPFLDAPGEGEGDYSEKSIRLGASFWCYEGHEGEPLVNELPALGTGEKRQFTFGCLNNFAKVNDEVLRLWGKVLMRVEGSRMVILAAEGRHRERTLKVLKEGGVESERIEFLLPRPRLEYLRLYHRIDLGLDTFPYNGHTTSLDSFWMGVPVVTLVGRTVVGRAGVSQLMNLGLPELIGRTEEEYVEIAAGIAGDLEGLSELRRTMRERMRKSPLMDAKGFTRNIEGAYREMWRKWVQGDEGT